MNSLRTALLASALAVALGLAACGGGPGLTVIPQDPSSLDNYAQGLRLMRQGRYLLAKEHFELAKATARDTGMEKRCDAQIAAAERAIKELR